MRLKLFILCFFFVFFTGTSFADTINGFDGFKWGSSREDITRVRGEGSIVWGDFIVWDAKDDEKVSDFRIGLIGYEFEGECSKIEEGVSEPCSLWGGAYILKSTSMYDINTLSDLLSKKYGEYKRTDTVQERRGSLTDIFLSKIIISRYLWELADKSAVELFYKSYDRDHIYKLNQVKKGVFRIGIRYYSPDSTQKKDSTRIKGKTF
jgi:hypothetical protein